MSTYNHHETFVHRSTSLDEEDMLDGLFPVGDLTFEKHAWLTG